MALIHVMSETKFKPVPKRSWKKAPNFARMNGITIISETTTKIKSVASAASHTSQPNLDFILTTWFYAPMHDF